MKKLPRKSASQPQHFAKTSTINSAEHESALLRLQLCFFLSAAAGLIDQVIWTKALGQLFGYSAYAVATVLAVFVGAWHLEVRSSRDGGHCAEMELRCTPGWPKLEANRTRSGITHRNWLDRFIIHILQ
jgi:hypothetical protein